MKRAKTAFGYALSNESCKIEVKNLVFGEKVSDYKVLHLDGREIKTRSLKSARVIASDFDEYYKIYNRNKRV